MKKPRKIRPLIVAGIPLSAIGALLSMVAISMGYRAPSGEEQPKVTDWMQAWGSIFGVLAGLAAAGAAAWLLMHERGQARQARAELAAERAEAMLVGPRNVVVSNPVIERRGTPLLRVTVGIHNYGVTPIRAVTVVLTPTHHPEVHLPEIDIIGPGSQRDVVHALEGPDWRLRLLHIPMFAVYFRDSTGYRWRRENNMEPERWKGPIPTDDEDDRLATPGA